MEGCSPWAYEGAQGTQAIKVNPQRTGTIVTHEDFIWSLMMAVWKTSHVLERVLLRQIFKKAHSNLLQK